MGEERERQSKLWCSAPMASMGNLKPPKWDPSETYVSVIKQIYLPHWEVLRFISQEKLPMTGACISE